MTMTFDEFRAKVLAAVPQEDHEFMEDSNGLWYRYVGDSVSIAWLAANAMNSVTYCGNQAEWSATNLMTGVNAKAATLEEAIEVIQ
jgi:hypothetical protein